MNRSRVSAWRADPAWIVVNPFTPDDRVRSSGSASALPLERYRRSDGLDEAEWHGRSCGLCVLEPRSVWDRSADLDRGNPLEPYACWADATCPPQTSCGGLWVGLEEASAGAPRAWCRAGHSDSDVEELDDIAAEILVGVVERVACGVRKGEESSGVVGLGVSGGGPVHHSISVCLQTLKLFFELPRRVLDRDGVASGGDELSDSRSEGRLDAADLAGERREIVGA